jgi:hypothetical protein
MNLKQPFKVSENMELREAYNNGVDDTLSAVREMVEGMKKDNVYKPDKTGSLYCADCGKQEDCVCFEINQALDDTIKALEIKTNDNE